MENNLSKVENINFILTLLYESSNISDWILTYFNAKETLFRVAMNIA